MVQRPARARRRPRLGQPHPYPVDQALEVLAPYRRIVLVGAREPVALERDDLAAGAGDGRAMYTLQSLWTMAREGLDVTVLVFANRSYRILHGELCNVGVANPGPRAVDMLTLDRPQLGWVTWPAAWGSRVAVSRTRPASRTAVHT